jgi:hypothetical protein
MSGTFANVELALASWLLKQIMWVSHHPRNQGGISLANNTENFSIETAVNKP